jgi:hypothetical protein
VTKAIVSNSDGAEFTETNGLSAFGSDGYTLNGNLASMNTNNDTYASWNWLANGAGSANTDGSINTVATSANTTSGFSIVKYTGNGSAGATVGHGLGSTPSTIFVKKISAIGDWSSYHSVLGNTGYMRLNNGNAFATASTYWNNTTPTSSVFTLGTTGNVNGSGVSYIAYCFAEKQGFSKMGSYKGNGNADGTFIYTGFSPAFIIIKNTNAGEAWQMFDNKRPDINQTNGRYSLNPNTNGVEYQGAPLIDLVSNGFKLRTSTNSLNVAQNFIYIAFAEEPLVASNFNPATAR